MYIDKYVPLKLFVGILINKLCCILSNSGVEVVDISHLVEYDSFQYISGMFH